MRQMIDKILNTYGSAVTLQRKDEEFSIRVFFQPVRSKSWQYLEGNYSPLGEIPRGQYVYIGRQSRRLKPVIHCSLRTKPTGCGGRNWYGTQKAPYIAGACAWKKAVRTIGDNRKSSHYAAARREYPCG